ncbi:hypothetical protein QS257_08025 [Terrilactibacillus sp. S3-3]|nr:hypothetical protein QS257_08025 [Terrilactibacillus sp. S3-3]
MEAELDLQMRRALFQYDLFPFRQVVSGNILQVETPRGQYALKRKKQRNGKLVTCCISIN